MPTAPTTEPMPPGDWDFVLLHGDSTTASNTRTELVDALIPGYALLADDDDGHTEALAQRYDHAIAVAGLLRTAAVTSATESGDLDPRAISEDVLNALFEEPNVPFPGIASPDGSIDLDWAHIVPLVLIATDYEPATALPRPTGRIVWIDPYTETTLLESLHEAGMVALFQRTSA
jgi:hypothetical protein